MDERPAPLLSDHLADTRRRRRAGAACRPAARSRPSIGKASASVASSMPRCSRFNARLSSGPTNASPSSPAPTPSPASTRLRELDRGAPRPPRVPERLSTSTSIICRLLTGSAGSRSARRARLYASTIRCTSLWRTTSWWPNSTKAIPSTVERMSRTWISPDACSRGRSTCVTSPVTTIFEPKPSRVRNICICSGDVFCASSRMTKLSLSVRPRMKASGATSIVPRSM